MSNRPLDSGNRYQPPREPRQDGTQPNQWEMRFRRDIPVNQLITERTKDLRLPDEPVLPTVEQLVAERMVALEAEMARRHNVETNLEQVIGGADRLADPFRSYLTTLIPEAQAAAKVAKEHGNGKFTTHVALKDGQRHYHATVPTFNSENEQEYYATFDYRRGQDGQPIIEGYTQTLRKGLKHPNQYTSRLRVRFDEGGNISSIGVSYYNGNEDIHQRISELPPSSELNHLLERSADVAYAGPFRYVGVELDFGTNKAMPTVRFQAGDKYNSIHPQVVYEFQPEDDAFELNKSKIHETQFRLRHRNYLEGRQAEMQSYTVKSEDYIAALKTMLAFIPGAPRKDGRLDDAGFPDMPTHPHVFTLLESYLNHHPAAQDAETRAVPAVAEKAKAGAKKAVQEARYWGDIFDIIAAAAAFYGDEGLASDFDRERRHNLLESTGQGFLTIPFLGFGLIVLAMCAGSFVYDTIEQSEIQRSDLPQRKRIAAAADETHEDTLAAPAKRKRLPAPNKK